MNHDLQTTTTNTRYALLRELGRGAGTVVDLVYDEVRHGTLACKRWQSVSAETRFRLRQQYRRTQTINHPNLVRLFELFSEGDATCLTMEAVSGVEVRNFVRALGDPSPIGVVLDVLQQLSAGLMALHAAGVVHRDVKPSNLLVEAGGRVVLLDAGFVWPRETHFEPLDEHTLSGTLAYLAPECLRGALPSVEADWYGFGALAFELLSGRPAFAGSLDAMLRAKDAEPVSLRATRPDVPTVLDDLVCGLLERDPRARPTGAQLQDELRELCNAHPSSAVRPVPESMPPTAALSGHEQSVVVEVEPVEQTSIGADELLEAASPVELSIEAAPVAPAEFTAATQFEVAHALPFEALDQASLAMTTVPSNDVIEVIDRGPIAPAEADARDAADIAPLIAEPESLPEPTHSAASAEMAAQYAPVIGAEVAAPAAIEPSEALATATFESMLAAIEPEPTLAPLDPPTRADDTIQVAPTLDPLPAPDDSTSEVIAAPLAEAATEPSASTAETLPDALPPSAAQPDPVERGVDFTRLEGLLSDSATTRVALIVGGAAAGKTRLLRQLIDSARERSDCWIFEARCSPDRDRAYNGFDTIMTQLAAQLAHASAAQRAALSTALANASLTRMFPVLASVQGRGVATDEALDTQRRLIDALLAFRSLWLQLAESQRVLICLDDCQFLDRDALRLLETLGCGEFSPKLMIVLACRSQPDAPEWLFAKLEHVQHRASGRSTRFDLKSDPHHSACAARELTRRDDATAPSAEAVTDPSAHLHAARNASDALALEHAADLYRRALERHPGNAQHWLADAARAQASAGHLEDAAQSWLALARSSQDRKHAQHCELEAAAALLHSGHEAEGRALLESVLRDCGLRWPRLPWLTSTVERARVLLGPLLSAPSAGPGGDAALRRFDALWAAAKEVVLLTPMAGDALSVQALREAVSLGDPSRLCWALGYEAALEANIGGQYMHRRARTLEAQVSRLAEQSGQTFDAAYARSVQGVVAWFAGRWHSAELALRDALRLYDQSPQTSAHERHVLESFLVGALEAQGKQCELAGLLVELRIAAEQTGHVHANAMCRLADASLPALARDQPLLAIADADAALSDFANDEFTPLRFQHCVVTVSARLYAGHTSQAYQQIEQLFRRSARAYFLRLDTVGVMLRQLRARAALAMTQQSTAADAEQLRKLAGKEAAAIGGTGSAHARALERVIRTSLACLAGDRELARQHCMDASEAFDRADMALMREVARRQHALLTRDAVQRARGLEQSGAFFRQAGIQNPAALTRAWFPVPTL